MHSTMRTKPSTGTTPFPKEGHFWEKERIATQPSPGAPVYQLKEMIHYRTARFALQFEVRVMTK